MRWTAGAAGLAVVIAVLAWGAQRLRAALLPTWSGAPARLAEAVLALAVPLTVAQVLGAVGAFSRWPVAAGALLGGVAMAVAGARLAPNETADGEGPGGGEPEPRVAVAAATGAAALVVAQWVSHVVVVVERGVDHADSIWYHLPYAARFVQRGRLTGLIDPTDALHAYVAHDAELVQALAILPFGRDVLAPFVNFGWLALALLAAWCIGRTVGAGSVSLLAVLVALGLPPLAGTHPGQASNDVAAAALVLAAVALLLHGRLAPVPTALAATAAGLAIATKLTVLAPVGVLTIGIAIVLLRSRPRPAALRLWAVWLAPLAVFGSYWFLRNLAVADSPLPWFDVSIGPFELHSVVESGEPFAQYVFDGSVWRTFYLPGLRQAFGVTWPLLLLAAIGSSAVGIVRTRDPLLRVIGAMVLTGVVSYAFTPLTADAGGLSFVFNLRYLTPTLILGLAVLPLWLPVGWRPVVIGLLGLLVVVNAFLDHYERIEAWPSEGLVAGVLAAVVVVLGVLWHLGRWRPPAFAFAAPAVVVAVVLVGGWFVQHRYLEGRYVDTGLPLDRINESFRDISDSRVAVSGTLNIYPLFGVDLSNRVNRVDVVPEGTSQERCRRWKTAIDRGDYDYLVAGERASLTGSGAPPVAWLDEPVATETLEDGGARVYRLSGPLDVDRC